MSDGVRPDEVIPPDGNAGMQLRGLARDLTLLLPNIVKLLGRLIKDPRVPRRSKLLVGGMLTYLASPVDFIPDFVPGLGLADDVILSVYAVNHLLEKAGEEVVLEHWDGPADLLGLVRGVLDSVGQLVPASARRWLERLTA